MSSYTTFLSTPRVTGLLWSVLVVHVHLVSRDSLVPCPQTRCFSASSTSDHEFCPLDRVLCYSSPGDGPVEDTKRILRETGVYILMFSNCQGSNPPVAVTGRVSVKNPYGYLPGTEYYKLPFYGWLSVLYTVLAFVWLGLSVKWWREALSLHACIAGVIFLGLMECFFFFVFFSDWNSDGVTCKSPFWCVKWSLIHLRPSCCVCRHGNMFFLTGRLRLPRVWILDLLG